MNIRICKTLLLSTLLFKSFCSYSQERNDSALNGTLICLDNILYPYPMYSDSILESNPLLYYNRLVYPTLIINNIIISDDSLINCFRNHFDKKKIKKLKWIDEKKAERKGIRNVSIHGALIIKTKKRYYFDLGQY